jgi:hypothetical protein
MSGVGQGTVGISMWRCESCGKWSHAQRQPKTHQRFIREEFETPEPAEFTSYEEPVYSYDGETSAGGWWIACGPFAEYVATARCAS